MLKVLEIEHGRLLNYEKDFERTPLNSTLTESIPAQEERDLKHLSTRKLRLVLIKCKLFITAAIPGDKK